MTLYLPEGEKWGLPESDCGAPAGGMSKVVVKDGPIEGNGWRTPKKLYEVCVHLVGTLEDGSQFDSSRESDGPRKFILGVGQQIKGLNLAILTMRRGDVAKFTFGPELAYGSTGLPGKVPPDSTVQFEIELLSWIAREDLFGDGGVIKATVVEGLETEKISPGDEVHFSYKCTGSDGSILGESSGAEPSSYILGSGHAVPNGMVAVVLEKALSKMRKGEKAELHCNTASYLPDGLSCPSLTVHIEAHEICRSLDVSLQKDGSLLKKQLREGNDWEKPEDSARITMSVERVVAADGSVLLCEPRCCTFTAGRGEICDALEFAALAMTSGERAVVTAARADSCMDSLLRLPADITVPVSYTVELTGFEAFEYRNLSEDERLGWAEERKEAAAKLFKDGRWAMAERHYKDLLGLFVALDLGIRDGDHAEERRARAASLKQSARLNCVACALKLGDFVRARDLATALLKEQPSNVKLLYRRASAAVGLEDYDDAIRDLKRVLELDEANGEAKKLLAESTRKGREAERMQRNALRASKANPI
eukprot:gnl/TRDRNA2_/TRDRNA2_171659_c0_seq1.p1 gnl/TRDRNA2_/TRDRNA2_171659_c0~~gnl/TRDRNA2_/TRDRNA2_171659_c0_seq1.p1  ORF type:complete len:537 (+),score=94.78 gnl/TRDRNA2_/TRDRNA2_171659_c0_seq1:91-1701(+)